MSFDEMTRHYASYVLTIHANVGKYTRMSAHTYTVHRLNSCVICSWVSKRTLDIRSIFEVFSKIKLEC